MAPSNMFSYLRPGHGKRSTTNLTSPDVSSPPAHPTASPSLQPSEYFSPRVPDHAGHPSSSPVSPFPPQLPPIPRVASRMDKSATNSTLTSPQHPPPTSPAYDHRPSSSSTSPSSPAFRLHGQSLAQVVEDAVYSQPSSHMSPPMVSPNYPFNSRSQTSLASGMTDRPNTSRPSTATTSAPAPKTAKSRLNLRNPMSLLMRRRSGQPLENLSDEALVTHRTSSAVPPMPDNYDPSIRGRIVHDFSAPRQNRNFSHNTYGHGRPGSGHEADADRSPPKVEREHTPVFREHFDDDTSYHASQAAIRAEQLVNKDFLARNSMPPPPSRSPPPPPPLPKDSPPVPPSEPPPPPPQEKVVEFSTSLLSPVQEVSSPTDPPSDETPKKRKSSKTPPASRSRATSVTDPNFIPAGLPAHMTSKSSRFSFQIAGNDSAQEKLLEERHKQKMAEKASKQSRMSTNTIEDDYDGYDDYDMDDGGFEEDIPMVGDDGFDDIPMVGDDGFDDVPTIGDDGASMSPGIAAFDFSSLSIPANPMGPISMNDETQTPRDASGNAIGFDFSEHSLQKSQLGRQSSVSETPAGLGLMDVNMGAAQFTPADTPDDVDASSPEKEAVVDLDDDMYFDDGMIEEQGELEATEFDENVFDDPSSPLYEKKMKPPPAEELRNGLFSNPINMSSDLGYEADDDDLVKHLNKAEPSLAHKPSMAQRQPVPDFGNLDAYHSALADAANRAQAEGRFARKASVDLGAPSDVDDSSSMSNSRPSLIPDDGRFSQETAFPDDEIFGMSSGFVDDYDYSEYDSALEDDPMIAAANAEALANDYEGFYGQEFGFYANADGETNSAYGGYFGAGSLGRSISGRNAVREPNLTPITERSEYSTRNSFISINHFRDGQQPLQSPGLAQLARMSPYGWPEDDPDMSFDTLMKLRKEAFRGSSVSLGSNGTSPRNSSPMQYMPREASPMNHRMNEEVAESDGSAYVDDSYGDEDDEALNAINAIPEDDEDDDDSPPSRPDSPTLTASDYNSLSSPAHTTSDDMPSLQALSLSPLTGPPPLTLRTSFQFPPPHKHALSSPSSPLAAPPTSTSSVPQQPNRSSLGLISPISTTSPTTPGGGSTWKGGHSRKGSAADSVTYVKEVDEGGGERWVLERRRTAESGEVEVLRGVVEGGRI
ncbi:hypothetical protein EJ04DRAFT_543700 [Polyplosphaeria fusca]|uniref:Uncharacterized protein n=1 Tax=Polyplosphaeria fusca TaxID=682080 RepID=A0A9P4QV20_9PLEO|nr:hypothetical protein EJ04DRAFT_543700 [Polyplosphaeria fusca]